MEELGGMPQAPNRKIEASCAIDNIRYEPDEASCKINQILCEIDKISYEANQDLFGTDEV